MIDGVGLDDEEAFELLDARRRSNSTLIDGASVKRSLPRYGLKLNFHRYIGQLRHPLPRLQKTTWRRFFDHRCRVCMYDDYMHAKRNDKAVPLNRRRRKNGEASHRVVSQK